MAVVRSFELKEWERASKHSEAEATVSLIDDGGEKFVQIDTYGSKDRQMPGKVSQSVRLTETVFNQIAILAAKHF